MHADRNSKLNSIMKTPKEQAFPETCTDTFWEPWEFVSFTNVHTMKEINFKMLIELCQQLIREIVQINMVITTITIAIYTPQEYDPFKKKKKKSDKNY